jgi:hypothetical protein
MEENIILEVDNMKENTFDYENFFAELDFKPVESTTVESILADLEEIDFSMNNLSGSIPSGSGGADPFNIMCGRHLTRPLLNPTPLMKDDIGEQI